MKKVELFEGLSDDETGKALEYLGKNNMKFRKGAIIINAGEAVYNIGIVLNGSVQIMKEDFDGARSIIAQLYPSAIFGEALAAAGVKKSPVAVFASSNCEILFIPFSKIINMRGKSGKIHSKIISNMLKILAGKNIFLNNKIEHLSKRSIREKLLSYLKEESRRYNLKEFTIPFNRNELADYLFLDRSAMSRELGKMRDDGLIEFDKSRFKLGRVHTKYAHVFGQNKP
ncbi:MAG: Crp/Fnr family transcriptional regulator [Endomicrobium sp.]|nr:Crp/Fnr family transcriptional regulator [Endomicrobium sp.]